MTFEEAKAFQKQLSEKVDTDTAILKEFDKLGTNQFGYANDQVRELPEYQAANNELNKSFATLRNFNGWMNKQFKKEIKKAQRELVKSRYKKAQ
jgi:hypothetical protein